jgi:drug/metabolite transporter (DMT)-like permease|tara:strand:- start:696 stop:1619 length:924 start_codon:yes stop_codon:yes gene_type:complete
MKRFFYFFTMFAKYKNYILLHSIILIYGFTGILGKLIEIDAVAIVWHRVFIAAISLFIAMLILRKSFKTTSRLRLIQICGVGVVVAAHWVTFFHSVQLSTASFGVLCLSTTTLHVSWLEPLILKRRFSWLEFGLSLIVVGGIYFVSSNFSGRELEALFYGLTSALFAALFSVFNAKLARDTPASTISFYEMVVATLSLSILLLCLGRFDSSLFVMTGSDFVWLLFLGIVCTSFAFLVIVDLVKHLGVFTVSLSINLEPVYAIVLGIIILQENEELNASFYLGSVLIVSVIFLNAIIKSSIKKRNALQ